MSHYQEQAIIHEENSLKHMSQETNESHDTDIKDKLFVNLSLKEIISNMSATIITIINELLDPKLKKTPENLLVIFFQDDRMIYLGLFIVFIGLGLYIIDITK